MGAEVKVVPLEPTPEMYGAGGVQQFKCDLASVPVRDAVGMVYRAMLAAAPAPTDEDPTTPEVQAGSEVLIVELLERADEHSLHGTNQTANALRRACDFIEAQAANIERMAARNIDEAARLSLRDTFIAEKGLWSEFAETVLHQQSSLEASGG